MRRRPKRLQVSTFPFLAVLLCAMGALILLLMVMDRRAKVTARLKAQQSYAEALAAKTKKLNERKDEWEAQRRAIHAMLARQYQDLLDEAGKVQSQSSSAQHSLQDQLLHLATCEQNLQQLKNNVDKERSSLLARRDQVGRVVQQDNIARTELEKLAKEVAQLEQTLLAMQLMQKQDSSIYSLVPYKGRRGDSRQPVYIECTAASIILHPEHVVVSREDGVGVRRAVEERLGRMTAAKADAKDTAYLLMLIRPNGIGSYYNAQSALQGLKLDFGYELIDRDWVLDFGTEEKAGQPWRTARVSQADAGPSYATLSNRPVTPYRSADPRIRGQDTDPDGPPPIPGSRGSGFSGPASPGQVGGLPGTSGPGPATTGSPSIGGYPGSSFSGPSSPGRVGGSPGTAILQPGSTGPSVVGSNSSGPPSGSSAVGYPGGSLTPDSTGPLSPPALGQPWGNKAQGGAAMFGPLTTAGPAGSGTDSGKPGAGIGSSGPAQSSAGPFGNGQVGTGSAPSGNGPRSSIGSLYTFGQSEPGGTGNSAGNGPPAAGANGPPGTGGPAGSNGPPTATNGSPTAGPAGASGSPSTGGPAGASGSPSTAINVNTGPPSLTFGQPPAAGGSNTQAAPVSQKGSGQSGLGNLGTGKPGPADANGGGDEPGIGGPGMRPPIPYVDERAKRPPPLPLLRTLGKKDYTIVVECFSDSITVHPGGKSFNVADLPSAVDPQCSLVQTVKQLIARRQGTLREGESPYRPVLRFQIHPGGRRSYFAAWPLLDAMKLPMSCENVD